MNQQLITRLLATLERAEECLREWATQERWTDATVIYQGDLSGEIADELAGLLADLEGATPPQDVIRDARRYRRLQILGCAPGESRQLENAAVLCFTNLDAFVDDDLRVHQSRGEAFPLLPPPHGPDTASDCAIAPVSNDVGTAKPSGQTTAANAERKSPKAGSGSNPDDSHQSRLSVAIRLAKEATNAWACYARRAIELEEIARLHREIKKIESGEVAQ